MCRINLKKVEARRPVQELKHEFKFDETMVQRQQGVGLEQLASQPGQPLYEEPLFNPALLTPLGMASLSSDCFPFPDIDQLSHPPMAAAPPSQLPPFALSHPAYQDLLASHSLGLEQPEFVPNFLPMNLNQFYRSEDFRSGGSDDGSSPVPGSSSSPSDHEASFRGMEALSPSHKIFAPVPRAAPVPEGKPQPLVPTSPRADSVAFEDDYEVVGPCSKKRLARNPLITEDKRERNRLAAEKYRKKGRELVTSLEKRCNDLSRDNNDLRQRNHVLEEEIQYLRSILSQNGMMGAEPLTTTFCR